MIKNFQKLITNYAYNNNLYCRFNFDGYIDEIDTIKGKVFYGSGFTLVLEYQLNYRKLFCRFILQQNPPIEYNPYDVLHYIDDKFYCLSFDYIENEKDLEICISYIFDVIDKYYERILELSYSEKIKDIENIFARDFDKYYNGNIFGNENIVSEYKEILFDDYYNIDNERYFKKEYKYFIEGKFDKAREIYLKNKNNLANYEMKVLEHIENTEKMELPVKNIESVSKYVFYKKKIFDIVNLLKIFCGIFGVGLSSCLCFAIYTVIYYFLMLVIKGQCTNVNRYVIAVLSIIPGIMMTFKLRKEWYDMFAIPNDLESNEKISKLEKKLILVYIILSFIIMIVNIKLI